MREETSFWATARPVLQALGLDPVRVENVAHDGFPDVSYTHGLIELKAVSEWPSRRGRVDLGMRPAQPSFLCRRWAAGGLCWMLARVGRHWLLFDGWTAGTRLRAPLSREDLLDLAAWIHRRGDYDSEAKLRRLGLWLRGAAAEMMPHDRALFHRLRARQTADLLAQDIGWTREDVRLAEMGSDRTDDLLAAWEC